MNIDDHLLLLRKYSKQFKNIDEVTPPSIAFEPAMATLLEAAMLRGTPLTRREVERVFPDPWEEIPDEHG